MKKYQAELLELVRASYALDGKDATAIEDTATRIILRNYLIETKAEQEREKWKF